MKQKALQENDQNASDDDDFVVPVKKKPKFNPGDLKAMFHKAISPIVLSTSISQVTSHAVLGEHDCLCMHYVNNLL